MRYCIQVNAGPEQQAALTALQFSQALLNQQHTIERIFFYRSGVHLMSTLPISTTGTPPASEQWQTFIKHYELDAVVCIGAALRRGVTNAEEAQRHDKDTANLYQYASLSGLGQWAESLVKADRFISFG